MSVIYDKDKKYNLHSWSVQKNVKPFVIEDAEGIYFYTEDGKKLADMSSQLVNSNLGHKNQAIINAICEQAQRLPFIGPGHAEKSRSEAAEAIVNLAGFEGGKVFFTNAGAESNENAIKIARQYTGKFKIFSMYRCYHGSSAGSGMLTGEPRHWYNEPGAPGFVKYDGPYEYRAPKACRFESEEDVADFYLELLENQIQYEGPDTVAAIFLESVVGSNGILIPPVKWYHGVRDLCDKYNIVMVVDEVMAGFYRTGKAFAFMNFGYQPDLVTFAKGATCGYVPLGGIIMRKEIADFFDDHYLGCGLTYSAHPMGCAATVAAISEYKRLDIEGQVAKTGAVLAEIEDSYVEKHACVGQVRHIGLFSAIELVKDKESREPLVPFNGDPNGYMGKIIGALKAEGFWTYSHENMIIIAPPLIITEEQLREEMSKLDKVLSEVDNWI